MKRILVLSVCAVMLLAVSGAWCADQDPREKSVNVEIRDVPLSEAIETLFKDTGINYTIEPAISTLKVTAVLRNVPLEVALRHVVRAAGASYRVEDGTVVISGVSQVGAMAIRKDLRLQPGPPPPLLGPDVRTEVVQLNNQTPGNIAPFVVKPGELEVMSSGNQLIVRGRDDAMKQALPVIQALDSESTLPRPVLVRMLAKAGGGTSIRPIVSDITITAVEGHAANITLCSVPKDEYEKDAMFLNVEASATPIVAPDGRISLAGSLTFKLWGNALRQNILSPKTTFAVSLQPGVAQKIASVGLSSEQAGQEAVLEIMAAATVGEGRVRVPLGPPPMGQPGLLPGGPELRPPGQPIGPLPPGMQPPPGQFPGGPPRGPQPNGPLPPMAQPLQGPPPEE